MNLEKVTGPLAKIYKKIDPNTISSSAEIMKERQTNKQLRQEWFWTKQSAVYTVEDGEVMLHLTDKVKDNLIFQNIDEAPLQLIINDNYLTKDKKSIEKIVDSVEGIRLSDLDLIANERRPYFEIDTMNYDSLNPSQRFLAEKSYGEGDEFKASMKLLYDAGIKKTSFYVTDPEIVEKHVEHHGALVRACRLHQFYIVSCFCADGGDTSPLYVHLRGVPKKKATSYNFSDPKNDETYWDLIRRGERK